MVTNEGKTTNGSGQQHDHAVQTRYGLRSDDAGGDEESSGGSNDGRGGGCRDSRECSTSTRI
ncbi:hypothetical protein GN958_ATG04580 [Phytophthora infestans]|uniref:Uncharacterized protein n=1 Tax=Phytophthora infestans TaxID=4787 RepID=A0A8S9V4X3_PHYIN|nr:hypothetical protein GN958_ATG04580 [Phytophthora infestans]